MDLISFSRGAAPLALSLAAAAVLSGCYVVPVQPQAPSVTVVSTPAPPPAPAPAAPVTFSARLYPANEQAAGYGMVMAVVTNDLHGRGQFSTNINGENYSGEATRLAGSTRDGVANGAGQRGGYISCRYTMNSPT
ncbi:MAG TPA: hypothetical protein VLJ58_19845 [Ramlibacter sp.]|nr:hypothetical protein [Ramlibacter sp.]